MGVASMDYTSPDPWGTLELAPGAVELYYRSAELEEMDAVWVDAAERAGEGVHDLDRVAAALAGRWRTQTLEHGGTVLVVGRYRLFDEIEEVRPLLGGDVLEGEQRPLVEALAAAAELLQRVPEGWLIRSDEAAERSNVGERMFTRYCAQGRVPGAHKRGRQWWVPEDFEILPHPDHPRRPRQLPGAGRWE